MMLIEYDFNEKYDYNEEYDLDVDVNCY